MVSDAPPPAGARPQACLPLIEAGPASGVLRVPGVAEYRVGNDGSVVVVPAPGCGADDVACFRDGPVAALAALLGGAFPLRAAAVAVGAAPPPSGPGPGRGTGTGTGTGIVLCGASATGKSAAAAALARRGARVLADKVVVLGAAPGLAITGGPGAVELWPSTARAVGLDPDGGRPVRAALDKRAHRLGAPPGPGPVRATVLVVLEIDNRVAAPQVEELTEGRQKAEALLGAVWHRRLLGPLGLAPAHLGWAASVAAPLRVARLRRPRRPLTLDAVADLVEALADTPGPATSRSGATP